MIRPTLTTFSADRTTASATEVELNTEIRANFVIGVAEAPVFASLSGSTSPQTGNAGQNHTGIAFDGSTSEPGFTSQTGLNASAGSFSAIGISGNKTGLAVGFHYATVVAMVSGGTGTWGSGDTNAQAKCYLHIGIMG